LASQVKPGNGAPLADDEQLEGQNHFSVPFGDYDTATSVYMAVLLLENTSTFHLFRN